MPLQTLAFLDFHGLLEFPALGRPTLGNRWWPGGHRFDLWMSRRRRESSEETRRLDGPRDDPERKPEGPRRRPAGVARRAGAEAGRTPRLPTAPAGGLADRGARR